MLVARMVACGCGTLGRIGWFFSRFWHSSSDEANMRTTFQLAPVIADIIAAHCPHTVARRDFIARLHP